MKTDFKLGDIVKYKNCYTEYEIVKIGASGRTGRLKLTKHDPSKKNLQSKIGQIYPYTPFDKLQLISSRRNHPLTTIFKDNV